MVTVQEKSVRRSCDFLCHPERSETKSRDLGTVATARVESVRRSFDALTLARDDKWEGWLQLSSPLKNRYCTVGASELWYDCHRQSLLFWIRCAEHHPHPTVCDERDRSKDATFRRLEGKPPYKKITPILTLHNPNSSPLTPNSHKTHFSRLYFPQPGNRAYLRISRIRKQKTAPLWSERSGGVILAGWPLPLRIFPSSMSAAHL